MNSYPASCDFMVARPPTYNENMEHFSRIQNSGYNRPIVTSQNNRYNRPIVTSQNSGYNRPIVTSQNSGNNRPIVTLQNNRHNNKSNEIIVVDRDIYYPSHRKNLRKRLCNIL